ncbi:hypothetical protein DCW30_05670 [Streptomyces alfalfae]|uniref:Transposase n=1 Tax=Streptomyces alfalfae TaxID=1642299 RepID=A0ABM6GWU8_9ACTN|nr:hypothetical protein [Streptomyces alfalfae]APY88211.1 hypothetical protein A7J05_23205 [Streptomyces alfalfae]AYA18606.1 hypothetical protein D3X13_22315 [Streptomyces fradiae]RXX46514.1 hypothetical protein DCW30_05670 [Streptomyces alfalfae]RZM90027.1 hypothetical protein D4104_25605 [Streptomyces alfalfae]
MNGVASLLTIDTGQGYEDRETGQIRYTRPPRARYECHECGTTEGPVAGSVRVREFVANVRTDHRARCSARTTTQQGAHTA